MIAKYQFLLLSLIFIFSSSLTSVHSKKVQGWTQLDVPLDTSKYFQYVALGVHRDLWGKANYSDSTLYRHVGGSWYKYQGSCSNKYLFGVRHNGLPVLGGYERRYDCDMLSYFQQDSTLTSQCYRQIGNLTNMVFGPSNTTWVCDDDGHLKLYDTKRDYFKQFVGQSLTTTDCNFAIDKYGLPWTTDGITLQRWDFSTSSFKTVIQLDSSGDLYSGQGDGSLYLVTYNHKIQKFNYETLAMEEIADVSKIITPSSIFKFFDDYDFVIGGKLSLNSTSFNYVIFPNYTEAATNLTDANKLEFIE